MSIEQVNTLQLFNLFPGLESMPSACTKTSTKSPYTFFTVDSDDDFDPYGSDVPSDIETKRELLLSHGLENQNIDIERGSCLSASSSTVSLPVCRICQLPGIEPSNPLISPCRCLGSIRYVHNNCLLVSTLFALCSRNFQNVKLRLDFIES